MLIPTTDVAAAIINQRQVLRLSQAELAELAGVSHSFVTKLEAGGANPGLKQLTRLLDVLGLSLSIVPKT